MIDLTMQVLAPRSAWGFCVRLVMFIGLVAAANFGFSYATGDHLHAPIYYVVHAAIVGGPFIAFFLAVTVFQIRLQRKLWRLSRKDSLTSLNNRRSFFEITEDIRERDKNGILLLLDADHFKAINDSYGHHAGDNCLRSIAYTIKRNIRKEDVVGRIGGEEFAIYLRATKRGQAKVIGERLTLPITFRTNDDIVLSVTLSIGAVEARGKETLDDLFLRADKALYLAKMRGRAQLVFSGTELVA